MGPTIRKSGPVISHAIVNKKTTKKASGFPDFCATASANDEKLFLIRIWMSLSDPIRSRKREEYPTSVISRERVLRVYRGTNVGAERCGTRLVCPSGPSRSSRRQ